MGLNVDIGNGKKSANGNSAGYQLLGQAGLNDYDKYSKSFYYNLIDLPWFQRPWKTGFRFSTNAVSASR